MAKKSLIAKQKRGGKFKVRSYTRCAACGRPRAVIRRAHVRRARETVDDRPVAAARRLPAGLSVGAQAPDVKIADAQDGYISLQVLVQVDHRVSRRRLQGSRIG